MLERKKERKNEKKKPLQKKKNYKKTRNVFRSRCGGGLSVDAVQKLDLDDAISWMMGCGGVTGPSELELFRRWDPTSSSSQGQHWQTGPNGRGAALTGGKGLLFSGGAYR